MKLDDSIGVPSTFVDYIEDDQYEGSTQITGIHLLTSTRCKGLLEYPEAVRARAMRRYPRNLGTFLILIVFFHSSGCRPYFIFLSFYSVVYSI